MPEKTKRPILATRDRHLHARLEALERRVDALEGRRAQAQADAENAAIRNRNDGQDYAGDE